MTLSTNELITITYEEVAPNTDISVRHQILIKAKMDVDTKIYTLTVSKDFLEDMMAIGAAHGLDIQMENQFDDSYIQHEQDAYLATLPDYPHAVEPLDETALQAYQQQITEDITKPNRAPNAVTHFVRINFNGVVRPVPETLSYEDCVELAGYKPGKVLSVMWWDSRTNLQGTLIAGQSVQVTIDCFVNAADTSNA